MAPNSRLPISEEFPDTETYVESLLHFATSNGLFMKLCGGVHILDFFTQDPDVYMTLLPSDWIDWFRQNNINSIICLLLQRGQETEQGKPPWLGIPPASLLDYIQEIHRHCLQRTFPPRTNAADVQTPQFSKMKRDIAVGMKPKKIHEVSNFAAYVNRLCISISKVHESSITDIVDFGAGQNYLGRVLASEPYNRHIIAMESRQGNIEGARNMDVTAKLAKKKATLWNKKLLKHVEMEPKDQQAFPENRSISTEQTTPTLYGSNSASDPQKAESPSPKVSQQKGSIKYVEHMITDGDLSSITTTLPRSSQLLIVSLHSCGNLIHHGIRSLLLNPSVRAIALIGCCYNLLTERLGPPSYKVPSLRPPSERVDRLSASNDPHGFPMSLRLANYSHSHNQGIRLNITARMMAVQAPANWTPQECEGFFTRHFFRALLQRIFVDQALLPSSGAAEAETSSKTAAIIIGSLRKTCYSSFTAYVRGAVEKIATSSHARGAEIKAKIDALSDADIEAYEQKYSHRKKELSVVWSLMAFSAGVVESLIVVDRWLFLKEHSHVVEDCWVEPVFEYAQSPRNLVVVGVKRSRAH